MSPREVTVGQLALEVRARGLRLVSGRVTTLGLVARVIGRVAHAREVGRVLGARRALASARLLASIETSPRRACEAAIEAHVLGVLVDVDAAGAPVEPEADETCPGCDGHGFIETVDGHVIPCGLCDERGLVARAATLHACEEAAESFDVLLCGASS